MPPNVIAVVFARGGSKGVAKKNLRMIGGRPLVAHAVEAALACRYTERVVVSTDDDDIAAAGEAAGAEVPFRRPAHLATDDAAEWLSWRHAVEELDDDPTRPLDLLLSVPPTSPLRSPTDLDACVELALVDGVDIAITVTPSRRNPWFNMVTVDPTGTARLVAPGDSSSNWIARRQDAPSVYDITTVAYAVRPHLVRSARSYFEGEVRALVISEERSLDIDTEFDLVVAEALFDRRT